MPGARLAAGLKQSQQPGREGKIKIVSSGFPFPLGKNNNSPATTKRSSSEPLESLGGGEGECGRVPFGATSQPQASRPALRGLGCFGGWGPALAWCRAAPWAPDPSRWASCCSSRRGAHSSVQSGNRPQKGGLRTCTLLPEPLVLPSGRRKFLPFRRADSAGPQDTPAPPRGPLGPGDSGRPPWSCASRWDPLSSARAGPSGRGALPLAQTPPGGWPLRRRPTRSAS